eukprot:Opistho-2@97004
MTTASLTRLACSSTSSAMRAFALCTNSFPPFSDTISALSAAASALGKLMVTPPNSSLISRTTWPRLDTKKRWNLAGTWISSDTMFSRSLMIASTLACAAFTSASLPMIVTMLASSSFLRGKLRRAPVSSEILREVAKPRPIIWRWSSLGTAISTVWPLSAFSVASSRSCCLAFSTSSLGPRMETLSDLAPSLGKRIWTPPHSSMIARTRRPLRPIMVLWNLDGMEMSSLTTSASSFWIALILSRAASTSSFLPTISTRSLSASSAGMLIRVLVSSLMRRMVAPPLPITCLWNFLKIGTSTV